MSFENPFESSNPLEREVTTLETRREVFSSDIDRRVEVRELEKEIPLKEELKQEIASAEVPGPKPVEKGKTPNDYDLWVLGPEELSKRRKNIRERYADVLDKIQPVGKELENDELYEKDKVGTLYSAKEEQEISYDNLVFVRADDFPPQLDKSGGLKILNPEEATRGKVPRETSHFTLNHRVASNNGGSWENKPYQFIIPGNAMVEKNGDPENLYAIDTFYTKSVTVPEGTVIVCEKGKKPEIPDALKDKITVVEREPDINDRELVSLIIEKMGYTEVIGGGRYSNTKNLDKLINKFAQSKDLRSGPHEFSWCYDFESSRFDLQDNDFESARRQMASIYREGDELKDEQRRMPDSSKQKIWSEIFNAFKMGDNDLKKARETKEDIERWIEKVLNPDSKHLWKLDIPERDREIMLQAVPKEGWQFVIDALKQNVQNGSFDDAEASSIFDDSFRKPFKDITHGELEINYA